MMANGRILNGANMMENENHAATLEAAGWKPRDLSGFIGLVGPLWTRREAEAWAYGLQMDAKHLNPAQRVHGGALMTLMDHAISSVAWEVGGRSHCVTIQMDSQFLGAVLQGQFVEVRVHITRQTGSLCFARAEMTTGAQLIMSSQAILKKLQG